MLQEEIKIRNKNNGKNVVFNGWRFGSKILIFEHLQGGKLSNYKH